MQKMQADTHMDSESEGATGATEKKRAVGHPELVPLFRTPC